MRGPLAQLVERGAYTNRVYFQQRQSPGFNPRMDQIAHHFMEVRGKSQIAYHL